MDGSEFGKARERFLNGTPPVMSDGVRRLAELVLKQRDANLLNPEPTEQWAERLVRSMYGETPF